MSSLIDVPDLFLPPYNEAEKDNYPFQIAFGVSSWASKILAAVRELQAYFRDGQGIHLTMFSASAVVAGTSEVIKRPGVTILFDGDPTGGTGGPGFYYYNGSTWIKV